MATLPITPTRLFDTCIFIDHWKQQHSTATRWILDAVSGVDPAAFSIYTDAELWAGIRSYSEEKALRVILSKMKRMPLIVPIARRAGELRKTIGKGLHLGDAIIAATAEYYNLPVYTNNTKDFRIIPNITVIHY